jgi:hypothetical protein
MVWRDEDSGKLTDKSQNHLWSLGLIVKDPAVAFMAATY